MQGRKTTTRAFRIDETVDRQLREWAEREGVSVSFLANKALRRLVEWDMYADRFGFIAMPREALSRMIELLSEDEVRDLGRWGVASCPTPQRGGRGKGGGWGQGPALPRRKRPGAPQTPRGRGWGGPFAPPLGSWGRGGWVGFSAASRPPRHEPRLR